MAKYEILIKAVTIQHLSYGHVAALYGVSKTLVHTLHHRWLVEGDAAFEPRSRRPHSLANRTPKHVHERVLQLRDHLTGHGFDSGADTIGEHVTREGVTVSRATIWRILTSGGKVTPQPQRRPRSSWRRITGNTVTDTFTETAVQHGYPAATLTDNGMVYTTRLARGGHGRGEGGGNGFETLLAHLGITQKNGKPYKPTTQGKIERFWQTLK